MAIPGLHPGPGSKDFVAAAFAAVSAPRSLSYTCPSWLTMKLMTPVSRYRAGHAMTAKPPSSLPPTR